MLPSYVLTVLGDRMEMAHSVEGRLPFLDHHVVELARDLPVSQKIRGMTEKYVLREAARPVLTATVYGRQKHPFITPPLRPHRRPALPTDAGDAPGPGPGIPAVLRPDEGRRPSGRLPAMGEARTASDPSDGPPECVRDPPTHRFTGLRSWVSSSCSFSSPRGVWGIQDST